MMRLNLLMLAALLGLSACVKTQTDGMCAALRPYEARARAALLTNATQTPAAVGEAVTDLLIGYRAGCGRAG